MKKLSLLSMSVLFTILATAIPASATIKQDSCNLNDVCATATEIPNVFSDAEFVCIDACNTDAEPELINNACAIGTTPTTWFAVTTDGSARLMNIHVTADFESPTISLFIPNDDCANLAQLGLTSSQIACAWGSNGQAEALGTDVLSNQLYYIAISSATGHTGEYEVCINTISFGSACVVNRNIEIVSRSAGGSLEGPFEPSETVGVCFNIESYTAAGNGCQWFQGLIPVFGNGWDPSSFDPDGQPRNTTLNGNGMGIPNNGLYGTATWDWFTDVDYHYDDIFLQLGDFDGNGSYDMCHLLYEADCPNTGGLQSGCCSPCWGSPLGTILPGGWFAYGINGTCAQPGPPIRVDWGDGNTCGGGMGPWHFCFELKVREYPECLEDHTTRDLTLGFFTLSDGQTGSWTGSSSICALDQPAKLTLPMKCLEEVNINLGADTIPALCAGDSLIYQIAYPGIEFWTWSINPTGYVQQPIYSGENGYVIKQVVDNQTLTPKTITYSFVGEFASPDSMVTKRMRFTVYPQIQFSLPPDMTICEKDSAFVIDPQVTGGTGNYQYHWIPSGESTSTLILQRPFPTDVGLVVSDEVGCLASDVMHIKTRPCLGGIDPPIDDDNEPDDPKDPPPPDENLTDPSITSRNESTSAALLTIMPVPAKERIVISLAAPMTLHDRIVVFDVNGHPVLQLDHNAMNGNMKSVDIAHLADGIYYVTLFMSRSTVTNRMVKL